MLKNLNEKSFLSFTGFLGYHFEIVVYYPKFSDLAFTPLISSFNLISFLRIVQFSRYKTPQALLHPKGWWRLGGSNP